MVRCKCLTSFFVSLRMRHAALLFVLLLLTGCVSSLQQLHNINPSASNYPTALAAEYQAFGDSEAEQGHRFAAEYYAYKGVKAAQGEAVDPEAVEAALPGELSEARERLMAVRTDDMKRVAPQKLARAQVMFDCWHYEVRHHLNQEQAPCADEFYSTMAEVQEVADSLYANANQHTLLFAAREATMNEENLAIVKMIAEKVANLKNYRVELQTYLGRGVQQRKLSETRIANARTALIAAGIPERRLRMKKQGSAKMVILSGDNLPTLDTKKIIVIVKTHKVRN